MRRRVSSLVTLLALVMVAVSRPVWNVVEFGARADGSDNTAVFAKLCLKAQRVAGATILVPAGRYVTGNVRLPSNTTLWLRDAGSVSGHEALVATGALRFLPPAEGTQRLEDWLAAGGPAPRPAGPRVLLRGVPAEHDRLHALVESLGAVIVAEDGDWGSREGAACAESSGGPLAAIAHHHASVVPCVRRHPADDGWFEQQLRRADIDAVLFHLPPPDDVHGWSYPADRARAEAAGKPSLRLRTDTRDAEATRPVLAGFLSTLRG